MIKSLKMYSSLAAWWPMVSSPYDYREEAAIFEEILKADCRPCRCVLELGAGGGNTASHLKRHFRMTLVDISPGMLKVSRRLNPECKHIRGDMRSVRLNRLFDAVFIHDAIMYMTTAKDLLKVFCTAHTHLRRNGCILVVPDFFKEKFKPTTEHHGHDLDGQDSRF